MRTGAFSAHFLKWTQSKFRESQIQILSFEKKYIYSTNDHLSHPNNMIL